MKRTMFNAFCTCLVVFATGFSARSDDSLHNRIRIHKKSYLVQNANNDGNEQVSIEKLELLSQKRRVLILDIRHLLASHHDEEQKAELNMRLGGLYMEDYYGKLAEAQKVFQAKSDDFKLHPKNYATPPKFDNSQALSALDAARGIYLSLLARKPNDPRRDEMLYFLAVVAAEKGQTKESMDYNRKLIEVAPHSKYANEALVQLGDYHFDANQFPEAEKYYNELISRHYKPLMAYAIYKKSWCAYNTKRTDLALRGFKWVIEHESTENETTTVRLKKEAMRDITLPFVDLKLVQESVAFFKRFGNPDYRQGLETMASLYQEAGSYTEARTLYTILLNMDSNYAQNPVYEVAIIDGLRLSNQAREGITRLMTSVPNYLKNSNWYEVNAAHPKVTEQASNAFEELMRKYALDDHAHAQKMKNDALYEEAKILYTKYLEYFPKSAHAGLMHFYLAEILFKQGSMRLAGENYWAAYNHPNIGNLKYDAIHYALISLDSSLNSERKKQGLQQLGVKSTSKLKEAEETNLQEIAYSDAEMKFIQVATEYLKQYPKKSDAPEVMYEMAYLRYTHHQLLEAYTNFWELVQHYPSHPTAVASATLILDVLNRRKDYPKLIIACKKFLETPSFTKPDFRAEVSDVLRHAELKRIQLIEAKGDYGKAAHDYVEYTKAYGEQDRALFEKALYNASVDYTKAENYLLAVETQEQFLRIFPKSQLRESMLLNVAKTYELFANFEKAGNYFEQFAMSYPQNPQSQNALRLAGLYFWGSGFQSRAENVMLTYLKRYPKDAKTVQKDLISLYESQGSPDKEIQFYASLRSEKGVPFSEYVADSLRIAELQGRQSGRLPDHLMEDTLATAEAHAADLTQSAKGTESLAKLLFWSATREEAVFATIKLALPQAQMERNLQRKIELLKDIERKYSRVAKLGTEWGLAAIYKTAASYRHMAQEIFEAPIPNELSGEQIDQYRKELQKQMIKPFKEKALTMAAQCLDKAQEFNLLSDWTPRCYSLAAELQPEHYPAVRTFYLPSLQVAELPADEKSKTPPGTLQNYDYPYYSTFMFTPPASTDAQVADVESLYEGPRELASTPGVVPIGINYRSLTSARKATLRREMERDKPSDLRKPSSIAYLNVLRVAYPERSITAILEAIQKDPSNQTLHNILGLAYLESGNLPAARVTWLAMIAQGVKAPAVWNNLGVVAMVSGNAHEAIDYFTAGAAVANNKETHLNLGYLALKYRNGFEAKNQFEKAVESDNSDASAQVGLAVGELQNRETDSAKSALLDLAKRFDKDPYARLSLSYYLVDVERESQMAVQMLSKFVDQASLENDIVFRQALNEARRASTGENAADSGSGDLPTIEQ